MKLVKTITCCKHLALYYQENAPHLESYIHVHYLRLFCVLQYHPWSQLLAYNEQNQSSLLHDTLAQAFERSCYSETGLLHLNNQSYPITICKMFSNKCAKQPPYDRSYNQDPLQRIISCKLPERFVYCTIFSAFMVQTKSKQRISHKPPLEYRKITLSRILIY